MARSIKTRKTVEQSDSQSVNQEQHKEPEQAGVRSLLLGWPMIIAWAGMIIFALHACTHMVAAGDTWVALACGRHFVNHGVNTVEPFSVNSHKPGPTPEEVKRWPTWAQWITDKVGLDTAKYWHPTGWINQNWLTHVIFYKLVTIFGSENEPYYNALVFWKFAIYILTVICIYYTSRIIGVYPVLAAVFACFAMFVGRSFLDVRPAGFSNLLVAVFLFILALTTYRSVLYIWLIVPLAVFWCNVHGGYIYAFIMLVPFIGLHLPVSVPKKRTMIASVAVFIIFVACFARGIGISWPRIVLMALVYAALAALLRHFRERFVSIGPKGICHTIAAGLVAFVAMVLFNPFHLTNLTHTFVISVSKHAERWRDIHEWHPAFEWENPVGTGFPFLVLCILVISLLMLWVFSHFIKPRLLKAPRKELQAQKERFFFLSRIFSYAVALFVLWILLICFSLLNLDAASLFICAIFVGILLVSTFKNVNFIFLSILLILLALWSADANAGYYGRYIYPFLILPAYVILNVLASLFSKTIDIKPRKIALVASAAIASLLLMVVIFNPFKFQAPVWNLKQFILLQRPWRPVYEQNLDLGYTFLFDVLFILNMVSVIAWLAYPFLRKLLDRLSKRTNQEPEECKAYQSPKIDLAMMTVATLTIYMAICSRRFIPIAAIAACPFIALFIDQIIRAISATLNFHKRNCLAVSPMPQNLQKFFILASAAAVSFLGTMWGLKFKQVYLDAWPADPKLCSVFMRMTASDAKPFYAGKFIRDNKLKGIIFNYWTEGGFIAWMQEPDPKTGRIPLQLFMDGRAQAAYDRRAFDDWTYIIGGGYPGSTGYEIVQRARFRASMTGQEQKDLFNLLTSSDYVKIGQSIGQALKDRHAWVTLMPAGQFDSVFVRALEPNPNWRLVFINNKQRMFVDYTTDQGKELFDGIRIGRTQYPDAFSQNLILAHYLLVYEQTLQAKKQGLNLAIQAFKLNPSPAPMLEIILIAARFAELRDDITKFCEDYFDEYIKNENNWAKKNGYRLKTEAARLACLYLQRAAQEQGNIKLKEFYATEKQKFVNKRITISLEKRW